MIRSFNIAQTFTIDPGVGSQVAAHLTAVDIYWMFKPASQNNTTGTSNPGVTLYVVPTKFGVPDLETTTLMNPARAEWSQIQTSSDASVPTRFSFPKPVNVFPGQSYAIVCSFDNNETFWPWLARSGKFLVGTKNQFNGTAGPGVGEYYENINLDGTNDPTLDQTQAQFLSHWRPLDGTFIKFNVYVARYSISGVPVSQANLTPTQLANYHGTQIVASNTISSGIVYYYPSQAVENVAFDLNKSNFNTFVGAQRVYQNTVFYPGGWANGSNSVSVSSNSTQILVANSNFPNGVAFNWNNVYGGYAGVKFITLFDTNNVNVRRISSIVNTTAIIVDEPTTFTNNISKFMITPVATIDSFSPVSPYGKKQAFMFLNHSNANSTVRFVNNTILTCTSAAGTSYSNSDVLYITGFESVAGKVTGGYPAIANLTTNSTGGIITLSFSNVGAGFVNAAAIKIVMANSSYNPAGLTNASANTSAGTGAVLTIVTGAVLQTELSNNTFQDCKILNLDLHDVTPFFNVTAPAGTTFTLALQTLYFILADAATSYGYAYFVNPNSTSNPQPLELLKKNFLVGNLAPAFVSYSNEFGVCYSNGSVNDKINPLSIFSNNYVLVVNTSSNNDYVVMTTDSTPTVEFGKYVINNDYTKENTNQGNAWAKHLTTIINFGHLAEDLRVYVSAYRPANTDIQVFARIQNSGDPESFDDEDWTRLTQVDGIGLFSSTSDSNNYVELAYGFQQWPNTTFTEAGFITTTNNSPTITGVGTLFQTNATANITANSVVRIYNPLFSNSNYLVAHVNNVVSDTSLNIDFSITSNTSLFGNPALVGSGLKMDVINNFGYQAFNNILFDNVARYYNTSLVKFDGFDNIQMKFVFQSSNLLRIPRLNNIRTTAVSA